MSFLDYVGEHYEDIMATCKRNLRCCGLEFDYDLFVDTILKCEPKMDGKPESEFEPYIWVSLKNNTLRTNLTRCERFTDEMDVENDSYDSLVDEVECCIKDRFGESLFCMFVEHVNGKTYNEFSGSSENVKYEFRRIREYVRSKFV